MEGASKNKEEILGRLRGRSQKNRDNPNMDWWLDALEVGVCDIDVGDRKIRVPEKVGVVVRDIICDPNKNSAIIPLGDSYIRSYKITGLKFCRGRFYSLDEWGRGVLLNESPDLLEGVEDQFSLVMKQRIEKWKARSGGNKRLAGGRVNGQK